MERKRIFAISGVKNSGKTTLICRLLEIFKDKGLKVAVLKHDGHDFVPDVPGTDTYCQLQSGAYGTAVFSAGKYMLVKQQPQISEKELAKGKSGNADKCCPDAEQGYYSCKVVLI